MHKTFATMLLLLMICGCAGREKLRLVADPSIIPSFPVPPPGLDQPLPRPMLPDLNCMQTTGSPSCRGAGLSIAPASTTISLPR